VDTSFSGSTDKGRKKERKEKETQEEKEEGL
jgi:hypothetical protein